MIWKIQKKDIKSLFHRPPVLYLEYNIKPFFEPPRSIHFPYEMVYDTDTTLDFVTEISVYAFIHELAHYDQKLNKIKGSKIELETDAWSRSLNIGQKLGFFNLNLINKLNMENIKLC